MGKKYKCKHNYGWCTEEDVFLYISPELKLEVGFKRNHKFLVRCNDPSCDCIRNAYLKNGKVVLGKIRKRGDLYEK